MGKPESFPKSVRIRTRREFEHVHATDYFAADDTLVIRGRRNGLKICRLGLSVGRPVGNAVVRNRWKRKIREAFRKQQHALPPGLDVVVRPRKGATCDYQSIFRSFSRLATRLDRKIPRSQITQDSEPSHE